MKAIAIPCPNCGGNLPLNKGEHFNCEYCGQAIELFGAPAPKIHHRLGSSENPFPAVHPTLGRLPYWWITEVTFAEFIMKSVEKKSPKPWFSWSLFPKQNNTEKVTEPHTTAEPQTQVSATISIDLLNSKFSMADQSTFAPLLNFAKERFVEAVRAQGTIITTDDVKITNQPRPVSDDAFDSEPYWFVNISMRAVLK